MIENFSIYNILSEWKSNKLLQEKVKGNTVEGYKHDNDDYEIDSSCSDSSCNKIMGLELGLFIVVSLIVLSIWFLALWSIWRYWDKLPEWAKIVSLIFLLAPRSGGPLFALLVVFFSKAN